MKGIEHRKDVGRDAMDQKISSWVRLSLQCLTAAITAAGVSLGTQFQDGKKIAELERKLAENEHNDTVYHSNAAAFCSVDLNGFCDPRAASAVDKQIQRALTTFEKQQEQISAGLWKQLRQLNPDIQMIDK